jgi:uncharacterized protein (TIGR00297 family)
VAVIVAVCLSDDNGIAQPRLWRFCLVRGSAATGLACAACAAQGSSFLGVTSEMYILGFVASFATKLSDDTFASKMGKAYGKTTFLIATLERVEPGNEGAVGAEEGTAASVVGGASLSLYAWLVGMISATAVVPVSILAAFFATNIESFVGCYILARKGQLEMAYQ